MTPQASCKARLNPFAPEYNPISPGVTPSLHAPPQFFLPPPPSTGRRPPPPPSYPSLQPPLLLPHQFPTHLPSNSHNTQHQCYTLSTYYVTHHNQASTTPPPQRPPPRASVAAQSGRAGGGFSRPGRGFGRERESSRSERVGQIRNFNFEKKLKFSERNCVRPSKHQQYSKRGMQKEENRHKTMPLQRDEEKTTVMIKNIPYDCPRKEVISMLDNFCLLENQKASNEGTSSEEVEEQLIPYAYDFLYLPIDFRTKKSRGFAFVNFTNSKAAWEFFVSFNLQKWDLVDRPNWPKKIEIVSAKIQGKEDLVQHFSGSVFECGSDEYLPVCFTPARDGSGQPVELTVVGKRLAPAARYWEARRCNHKA